MDWYNHGSASAAGELAAPRAPVMSMVQQLCELVAPGSISLGMGLSNTIPDDPVPPPVSQAPAPAPVAPAAPVAAEQPKRAAGAGAQASSSSASSSSSSSAAFEVGKITTRREVVERQVVQLRRVEHVKGDVVRAQTSFTAVTGTTVVLEQREGGKREFKGV